MNALRCFVQDPLPWSFNAWIVGGFSCYLHLACSGHDPAGFVMMVASVLISAEPGWSQNHAVLESAFSAG
jgi:hypothetical protein